MKYQGKITDPKDLVTKEYVDTGLSGKQNALTFDDVPTAGSSNPVKSSGIKSAITQVDENIATVESSAMASKNYIAGELLVLDGVLYVTASNISSGAALIPGSNIIWSSIATVVKELSITARHYGNSYITPGSGMTINFNARSVGAMTYVVITMTGNFTKAKLIGTVAYDSRILPKTRPYVPLCDDVNGGVNGYIIYNPGGAIHYFGNSLTNRTMVATVTFINQTVTDVEQ